MKQISSFRIAVNEVGSDFDPIFSLPFEVLIRLSDKFEIAWNERTMNEGAQVEMWKILISIYHRKLIIYYFLRFN